VEDVFVFDAVRAPRTKGSKRGAISSLLPHQVVAQLIDGLRARTSAEAIDVVDSITLSCVGQVGAQGGHLALVSKLEAGLPDRVAAQTINNYCVGGLTAVGNAFASVRSGQSQLCLAGGIEMMSHVRFLGDEASFYTDETVSSDLRWAPVGVAADHLAFRHGVERVELDALAMESHRRAAAAWDNGHYDDQVVPITTPGGSIVYLDETIKRDLTAETLAALDPVFEEMGKAQFDAVVVGSDVDIDHRHTIAHCPPIADGAAMLLVGTASAGWSLGLEPLARIDAMAEAGGDSVDQLTAGENAMQIALARGDATLDDMDVIEYMEAFAVVPALFRRSHDVDLAKVNPNGGHLAMGHPMGATGAILATAVAHELRRTNTRRGIAVAHGGSGVGAAVVLSAM
jgi:acetyl-CoA C-acetyltransferase